MGTIRLAFAGWLALLATAPAAAVGLGEIQVQSGLNERFQARIPLRGLKDGEIEGLNARLGDEAAFKRAGVERRYLLTRLLFKPTASGERGGHVAITSRGVIREPSLSFVVAVRSQGQVVERRYDVVLNLK